MDQYLALTQPRSDPDQSYSTSKDMMAAGVGYCGHQSGAGALGRDGRVGVGG